MLAICFPASTCRRLKAGAPGRSVVRGKRIGLGVSYHLAPLNVPATLVIHVLIFAYLLGRLKS